MSRHKKRIKLLCSDNGTKITWSLNVGEVMGKKLSRPTKECHVTADEERVHKKEFDFGIEKGIFDPNWRRHLQPS